MPSTARSLTRRKSPQARAGDWAAMVASDYPRFASGVALPIAVGCGPPSLLLRRPHSRARPSDRPIHAVAPCRAAYLPSHALRPARPMHRLPAEQIPYQNPPARALFRCAVRMSCAVRPPSAGCGPTPRRAGAAQSRHRRIARERLVALQHDQPVLIGLVVVEPGRTHDRIGQAARANQTLGASLPVVRAPAVGRPDRRHERDAHLASAEVRQARCAPRRNPPPLLPLDRHRFHG